MFASTFSKEIIASFVSCQRLCILFILRRVCLWNHSRCFNSLCLKDLATRIREGSGYWGHSDLEDHQTLSDSDWFKTIQPYYLLSREAVWIPSVWKQCWVCKSQIRTNFPELRFYMIIGSYLEQVKMLKQNQNFEMFWGRADWYFDLCFCHTLVIKFLYTLAFSNNIGGYVHW